MVFNEKEEILMIFRMSKWDLPKGKLDPGEKIEECALREVKIARIYTQLQRSEMLVDK